MKSKITWTWKKIVGIIAGIFGIGTLTSCYGSVPLGDEVQISGTVTGEVAGVVQPIPGIRVCSFDDFTDTDKDGKYTLFAREYAQFWFTDGDGEENGLFESFIEEVIPGKTVYDVQLSAHTLEDPVE